MEFRFSKATEGLTSSAVREILKLTQGKEIISFAGGLPAEELFPLEAIRHAYGRVFEQSSGSLQYNITEGYTPLREALLERLARKGIVAKPANMILTTGSQQAIDLLCRVLLDPGEVVLVENPTYLAALQVLSTYRAEVVPVAGDVHGMLPDDLEQSIKTHKPKLIYITPTFSNPAGKTWSAERRAALAKLAVQYGVVVLEDDPYGDIQFKEQETYPKIASMIDSVEGSPIVYTSTFSKTVAPAVRTGWAVGDTRIIQMIARAKQASDLHSSSLDQQALYFLLREFDLDAHIGTIREHYRGRMEHMQRLLRGDAWEGVRWNEPLGGMFLWLELPENVRSEELLKYAVQEGVAFVPGSPFYGRDPQHNTIRMNYTHTDPERMTVGMERLSRALQSFRDAALRQ